jgi:hypothetical protein
VSPGKTGARASTGGEMSHRRFMAAVPQGRGSRRGTIVLHAVKARQRPAAIG